MFSFAPLAWKYAHASTLFACACDMDCLMLPALTLQSAMKVAMTATLTATSPFRLDFPCPPWWCPCSPCSACSIASFTFSASSLMPPCYPGSRGPSVIAIAILLLPTIIQFTFHWIATHRPARSARPDEWQSRCTEGGQLHKEGLSMTLTTFTSFFIDHPFLIAAGAAVLLLLIVVSSTWIISENESG